MPTHLPLSSLTASALSLKVPRFQFPVEIRTKELENFWQKPFGKIVKSMPLILLFVSHRYFNTKIDKFKAFALKPRGMLNGLDA